jgi:hypothetical protein
MPDFTTSYRMATIFGQIDTGELAARLGSLTTLDRRGNIIWMDDFEGGDTTKWATSIDAGGSAAISNTRAWMGTQSMKTVTNAAAGDDVTLAKAFALPTHHTMGVELMYCMPLGKPIIRIRLLGYDGTNYFVGQVEYDHNTQKLYYNDSDGLPVELTRTDSNVTILEPWFLMKLVVDWDAKKYMRFIFCGSTYDLSAHAMQSIADATKKHIEVYIYNEAGTNAAATVYFDNFIFTQNEP